MLYNIIRQIVLFSVIYLCVTHTALANSLDYDELIKRAEQRRIDIANIMEESTVFILCFNDNDDDISFGSGFVVAPGYVLTNAHVTKGYDHIQVSGSSFPLIKAKRVKEILNDSKDLTLLKISPPPKLPVLSFNTKIRRTDRISAWGYPAIIAMADTKMDQIVSGEFDGTPPLVYTDGAVSSFVNDGQAVSIIHSAVLANGNSGGPLINTRGEVIGINTWRGLEMNEGIMANGAHTAKVIIDFLRSCKVEPRIVTNDTSSAKTQPAAENIPSTTLSTKNKEGSSLGSAIQNAESTTNNTQKPDNLSSEMQKHYMLAQGGNAEAQAYVGVSLYYGDDAPEKPDLGVYWLQKAMSNGNVYALAMYGAIQITDPHYKNIEQGLKHLKDAAKKDAKYAATLAHFLYTGEIFGVSRNFEQAFAFAQKGASSNDIDATALLAFFYFEGIGTKQDNAKALKYANLAAKKENSLAYAVLSWLYHKGFEVKQNSSKAFEYASLAAKNDEPEGIALLAYFYHKGIGVEVNQAEAFNLAIKAAEDGNDFGRILSGLFYAEGYGVKKDIVQGVAYLSLALQLGDTGAQELYDNYSKKLNKKQKQQVKSQVNIWLKQWGF